MSMHTRDVLHLLRRGACNTLQHTATHCNTLQYTATHCNTLQHTATHCNTLQHTATHCNTLQHTVIYCNTLQHTATRCDTLHHTATNCNTLEIQRFFCDQKKLTRIFGKWHGVEIDMVLLRLVGSLDLYISFAKAPYKRDDILQKRPIFSKSLLIVATPHGFFWMDFSQWIYKNIQKIFLIFQKVKNLCHSGFYCHCRWRQNSQWNSTLLNLCLKNTVHWLTRIFFVTKREEIKKKFSTVRCTVILFLYSDFFPFFVQ